MEMLRDDGSPSHGAAYGLSPTVGSRQQHADTLKWVDSQASISLHQIIIHSDINDTI